MLPQTIVLPHAPLRNASVVGAHVYSHSAEFAFHVVDLALRAGRISFQFARVYRSAHHHAVGALGRGWSFTYARRIEQDGPDILYHDDLGQTHRFSASGADTFSTPDGLYAVLTAEKGRYVLHQRYGDRDIFATPDAGGRLMAVADTYGNRLGFDHRNDRSVITDAFGRRIIVLLDDGRVAEVRDHAGRIWRYAYDRHGCLVEARRPAADGGRQQPAVRYAYDDEFRLVSITDPKGQTFLRNTYDERGRVRRQVHGHGTFHFEYDATRTRITLKNGARLDIAHDAGGHAIERTLFVAADALGAEDGGVQAGRVPLTITDAFNRHGERIRRTWPSGRSTEWIYDDDHADPRARGNLLRVTQRPAPGAAADVSPLSTTYTYEPQRQQVQSVTNPRGHTTRFEYDDRGNLATRILPAVTVQEIAFDGSGGATRRVELRERFEYDAAGQITRYVDPRGAATEYFYHPLGYLAGIVRDADAPDRRVDGPPAKVTIGFEYDQVGNVTAVVDGKSNATRYSYDAHDRLVGVRSRPPLSYEASFRHDLNGNMVEGRFSFDHCEYDPVRQELVPKTTVVRQRFEYDVLNNIVRRTATSGGHEILQTLVRNAADNLVRDINPIGNVIEYEYDERDLPVRRRIGVGSADQIEIRHTYSANGKIRSTTGGRGQTERYEYDAFDRYVGYANAAGSEKRQWLDEAGNVTRLVVTGAAAASNERGEPQETGTLSLFESSFHFDELNRLVRVDRAWRDLLTGDALGKSGWDGRTGVVSQIVEYGENHLPARLWTETGNVVTVQYDGANRVSGVRDATGESLSVEYDANSNPLRVERVGPPAGDEPRLRQVWRQEFDALDRPIARFVNDHPRGRVAYNALNAVVEQQSPAGVRAFRLHDSFGRPAGVYLETVTPAGTNGQATQVIVERAERDGSGLLVTSVNARGCATHYRYDALGRLSAAVYADGSVARVVRDAAGNVTQFVAPNGSVVTNRFDAAGNLIARSGAPAPGVRGREERFHYDGLGRIVAAIANDRVTTRRYDSLSRLLEESQSGRMIRYGYDAAGNCTRLIYPGGREIERAFDARRRLVAVVEDGRRIAGYRYRGGTQPSQQNLGGIVTASFTYDETGIDRLNHLVYRSASTGEVVDGRTYRYDANGNLVEQVPLRRGDRSGERYVYDSLDRLVLVQYGVQRLSPSDSSFEREVCYEVGPTGLWERRTTSDADGNPVEDVAAVPGLREAYLSLGERRFRYDRNGNRLEDEDARPGGLRNRYVYDDGDRLVAAERVDSEGRVVERIEYGYDALGRQVSRQITRDGATQMSERIWDDGRLIEEWENGSAVKSFVYGANGGEPLEFSVSRTPQPETYLYSLDGRGVVTGLIDAEGRFRKNYALDVAGQPRDGERDALLAESSLLVSGSVWDSASRLFVMREGVAYDPSSMRFLSDEEGGPDIEDAGWGLYIVGLGVLIVGPNPFVKAFGLGLALSGVIGIVAGKSGKNKPKGKADDSKSGSSGSSSSNDSGQKKDDDQQAKSNDPPPEHPNKDDYHREKHPHVTVEEVMPNPEDGGGEGIDKDWWRQLPYADAKEALERLKRGPQVDERHETVWFPMPTGDSYLIQFLTPQLITVDEGGEGITINLKGAHSEGRHAGISTSDGWGDKPRSLAEAYAAKRIQPAAMSSRF